MKRLIALTVAAAPLAFALAIRALGYCYPGCVIWDNSDPEWYVFFCYLCGA